MDINGLVIAFADKYTSAKTSAKIFQQQGKVRLAEKQEELSELHLDSIAMVIAALKYNHWTNIYNLRDRIAAREVTKEILQNKEGFDLQKFLLEKKF